jgi:hypothetical protein
MVSSRFWELVAVLDGEVSEQGIEQLTTHLSTFTVSEILAFHDDLTQAVHALDTPEHFAQQVHDLDEPTEVPPPAMSADVFLFARLATVAAGQDTWNQVLAHPEALSGRWPLSEAEGMLEVAPQALAHGHGLAWDHEPVVSMETGSNTAAWGTSPEAGGRKWWTWLLICPGLDEGVTDRPAYTETIIEACTAMDTDEDWRHWWTHALVPDLELHPFFTPSPNRTPTVRRGRAVVKATFHLPSDHLAANAPQRLRDQAIQDLTNMLNTVRDNLGLADCPPLPPLAPLPADLPDTYPGEHEDLEDLTPGSAPSQLWISATGCEPAVE